MSSVYKNLTDEDLKVEKQSLKALEKNIQRIEFGAFWNLTIIAAFLLSAVSLAGSAYLYQSLNKEKRHREALEASQVQLRQKALVFEQTAQKSGEEIQKLQGDIKNYRVLQQQFTRKLEESGDQISELRGKLKEVEEKTTAMKKAAEKIQTEFELQPMGPALPGITPTVSAGKTQTAASSVAVPKPTVSSAAASIPSAVSGSKILTVNRKFNFVVVNLGLKGNAKMGDQLKVERNGKTIGAVTIEKLYDNFSAAAIVKESKEAPIKEGDKVSKA